MDTEGEDEQVDGAVKPWLRHSKRALWIVALSACLPVFYILSIGPAVMLYNKLGLRGSALGSAMGTFYSPVGNYIGDNQDRAEVGLLVDYIEFWEGD